MRCAFSIKISLATARDLSRADRAVAGSTETIFLSSAGIHRSPVRSSDQSSRSPARGALILSQPPTEAFEFLHLRRRAQPLGALARAVHARRNTANGFGVCEPHQSRRRGKWAARVFTSPVRPQFVHEILTQARTRARSLKARFIVGAYSMSIDTTSYTGVRLQIVTSPPEFRQQWAVPP